ncbi:TraX protein [Butyrivibrio fibrisolvens DSM 3071]|uniref:TraX protein n=1 Tax=Butyrivibrio fibrisolvens DSM 3071 TaxID=1121131 RepID=A0A1M5T330_BUTFI|nr:hypothetical protein [Butyrivibrio fibrisolvens]SHH44763.1 TraX protein [Butyrivibrio fibrisolvens DSM 3071]
MYTKSRVRFLDGTMLKIIAMVSMVFDHVGDMFFSGSDVAKDDRAPCNADLFVLYCGRLYTYKR